MIHRFFYGPGDWLASHFTARQRRAVATWIAILTVFPGALTYLWKDTIWMVWLLSIIALEFGAASWAAAETPMEEERHLR